MYILSVNLSVQVIVFHCNSRFNGAHSNLHDKDLAAFVATYHQCNFVNFLRIAMLTLHIHIEKWHLLAYIFLALELGVGTIPLCFHCQSLTHSLSTPLLLMTSPSTSSSAWVFDISYFIWEKISQTRTFLTIQRSKWRLSMCGNTILSQ